MITPKTDKEEEGRGREGRSNPGLNFSSPPPSPPDGSDNQEEQEEQEEQEDTFRQTRFWVTEVWTAPGGGYWVEPTRLSERRCLQKLLRI